MERASEGREGAAILKNKKTNTLNRHGHRTGNGDVVRDEQLMISGTIQHDASLHLKGRKMGK